MDAGALLLQFFADVRDHVSTYLTGLATLSLITMGLIQSAKTQFPVRRWFNKWKLRYWLARHLGTCDARSQDVTTRSDEIVRLAADGDADAFYNVDIDDLAEQLQTVTQLLVDYPSINEPLLRVLASGAAREDLHLLIGAHADHDADKKATKPMSRETAIASHRQAIMDARYRVRAITKQSIGALRLAMSEQWKKYLQAAAFVISASITLSAFYIAGQLHPHAVVAIEASVLAGFLAPAARDLLAVLEKLRE